MVFRGFPRVRLRWNELWRRLRCRQRRHPLGDRQVLRGHDDLFDWFADVHNGHLPFRLSENQACTNTSKISPTLNPVSAEICFRSFSA